jgi:hypothetical protein
MLIFIVLSLLMAFAALLAVAYPILARTPGTAPASVPASEVVDELLAQRDTVFQALRELRFDHEVGKITDEDYVAFEGNLKQSAANSLRALDRWEAEADSELDEAIEGVQVSRAAAISAAEMVCPICGHPAGREDKFCGRCGAVLPEAAAAVPAVKACPNCGRPFEAGDRFCASCGLELHPQPITSR